MPTTAIQYATTQSEIGAGTAWTNPTKVLGAPDADPATVTLVGSSQSKVILLGGFTNLLTPNMRPTGLIVTGTVGTSLGIDEDNWGPQIYRDGVALGSILAAPITANPSVQTRGSGASWGTPLTHGLAANIQIGIYIQTAIGTAGSLEGVGIQWVWAPVTTRDRPSRVRLPR